MWRHLKRMINIPPSFHLILFYGTLPMKNSRARASKENPGLTNYFWTIPNPMALKCLKQWSHTYSIALQFLTSLYLMVKSHRITLFDEMKAVPIWQNSKATCRETKKGSVTPDPTADVQVSLRYWAESGICSYPINLGLNIWGKIKFIQRVPSGNLTVCYWKWP